MSKIFSKSGLTKNVVFLGIVSGLTDISSEMLYPVVPIFLTQVLKASMTAVGFIEGAAEATASLLKIAGGIWSDRVAKRKPFVIAGYSLSSISKPLLAFAVSWHCVLFARLVDRTGKGIRTSARDALIASSTEKEHWGKAFGFHRAMDTLGAAAGPLISIFLLSVMHLDFRTVFLIAFVPAIAGVLILLKFVKEAPQTGQTPPLAAAGTAQKPPMSREFKIFLLIYSIFAIGNSSDVFLILKAKDTGFTTTSVIFAYTAYNIVYALFATPAGWLSDRIGKLKTIMFGLIVFAIVYSGFGLTASAPAIWILFMFYGFYGTFTEGIVKAVISNLSVSENRGTAMGYFHASAGLLMFAASTIAGFLWSKVSPSAPFVMGAACSLASACLLFFWLKAKKLAF
ncbi:MAG: MFS transporter [Elusimicrobia bacterium]|nr:MFS transporter [Elusimicrobiota bacterium]